MFTPNKWRQAFCGLILLVGLPALFTINTGTSQPHQQRIEYASSQELTPQQRIDQAFDALQSPADAFAQEGNSDRQWQKEYDTGSARERALPPAAAARLQELKENYTVCLDRFGGTPYEARACGPVFELWQAFRREHGLYIHATE